MQNKIKIFTSLFYVTNYFSHRQHTKERIGRQCGYVSLHRILKNAVLQNLLKLTLSSPMKIVWQVFMGNYIPRHTQLVQIHNASLYVLFNFEPIGYVEHIYYNIV